MYAEPLIMATNIKANWGKMTSVATPEFLAASVCAVHVLGRARDIVTYGLGAAGLGVILYALAEFGHYLFSWTGPKL